MQKGGSSPKQEKQEILIAESHDTALLYNLINLQINSKINVSMNYMLASHRPDQILDGWRKHFGELATQSLNPLFDNKYKGLFENNY